MLRLAQVSYRTGGPGPHPGDMARSLNRPQWTDPPSHDQGMIGLRPFAAV